MDIYCMAPLKSHISYNSWAENQCTAPLRGAIYILIIIGTSYYNKHMFTKNCNEVTFEPRKCQFCFYILFVTTGEHVKIAMNFCLIKIWQLSCLMSFSFVISFFFLFEDLFNGHSVWCACMLEFYFEWIYTYSTCMHAYICIYSI